MAYKATGIDPEIDLRARLKNIKHERSEIRRRLFALPGEIRRAFAAPKDSAEYRRAGALVTEQKKVNARLLLINNMQDRIERTLGIQMVGRT